MKLSEYTEELGKCLKKESARALKEFIKAHNDVLYVPLNLPDEVYEIMLRKMICHRTDMPKALVKRSSKWLIERGYGVEV